MFPSPLKPFFVFESEAFARWQFFIYKKIHAQNQACENNYVGREPSWSIVANNQKTGGTFSN